MKTFRTSVSRKWLPNPSGAMPHRYYRTLVWRISRYWAKLKFRAWEIFFTVAEVRYMHKMYGQLRSCFPRYKGRLGETELATMIPLVTLPFVEVASQRFLKELSFFGNTAPINGLVLWNLAYSAVAIGTWHMYEHFATESLGRQNPIKWIISKLQMEGKVELANELETCRLAINVLKHGRGPSYDRLRRQPNLTKMHLRITEDEDWEGVVGANPVLLDFNEDFIFAMARSVKAAQEVINVHDKSSQQ